MTVFLFTARALCNL